MGFNKRIYEDIYSGEYVIEEYQKVTYTKNKMFFEKNGDDLELIDVKKCQDSGMGDDQHQKP